MKKFSGYTSILLLLFFCSPIYSIPQNKVIPVDYVFLIDVSGSMVGQVGHNNIFPRVQKTIEEFISQIQPGANIFFFPFEGKIRETKTFQIKNTEDIATAQAYIRNLEANGSNTAIYNSIQLSLEAIDRYRREQSSERAVVFFVYTDGDDNVSKGWTLESILKHFDLKRGKHDWLFYTELGLPRDIKKEDAFKGYTGMQYVQEQAGNVHPIIQVETLTPVLNFGNLKQIQKSTRGTKFALRGKGLLPDNYRVNIESEFESLQSQGAYVQVSPATFYPSERVNLELSILNTESVKEGKHEGRFRLLSSDPLVIVVPNEIEVSFLYEPERVVDIIPSAGSSFPLDLGEIELKKGGDIELKGSFFIRYNPQAELSSERLTVKLIEDQANPQRLQLGKDFLIAQINGSEGWVGPETKQLEVVFKGRADFLTGKYSGEVIFESEKLRIDGTGLRELKNISNAKALTWSFYLKSPPWPWWVWLLTVLFLASIAFVTIRHKMKPPVLPDLKLEVKQPQLKDIDLSGKPEANFGKNGEYFPESEQSFIILPKKEEGKVLAILRVNEGRVLLTKAGEHQSVTLIGEEKIFDGDRIEFDDKKIMISSFSLSRDESQS